MLVADTGQPNGKSIVSQLTVFFLLFNEIFLAAKFTRFNRAGETDAQGLSDLIVCFQKIGVGVSAY